MTTTKHTQTLASIITILLILSCTALTSATTENGYNNDNNLLSNIFESTHTENGYKAHIIISPTTTRILTTENNIKLDLTINPNGIGGQLYENNLRIDLNPTEAFPDCSATAQVGITGYKLVFKAQVQNLLNSPITIDYLWIFNIDKWNGMQWVATAISGSSTLATGYSIPALSTVDLPYYVYILPMTGPNTVMWGNWLRISYTFYWTCMAADYAVDYAAKLHVHPPDIAGTANTAPYYGADGTVGPPDLGLISPNWKKTVSPGTDPTSNLAKADIDGDNYVGPSDLGKLSARWKQTWANTPPLN